jgi:hypothetical protein
MNDEIIYQLKAVKSETLTDLKIENQSKIIAKTGEELVPQKAFEIIREESKGFTERNEKAEQGDTLMMKLLEKNGIVIQLPRPPAQPESEPAQPEPEPAPAPTDKATNILALKERERLRMLELLELELSLDLAA